MDYEESQSFGWVGYVIVAAAVLISLFGIFATHPADSVENLWGVGITFAVALLLLNLLHFRIRVSADAVHLRFGLLIPFFWKRFPLESIHSSRAITFRPLRDSGGWGIRFGQFEGESGWFYTAIGARGVALETDKGLRIIGSQEPEKLQRALTRAIEKQRLRNR